MELCINKNSEEFKKLVKDSGVTDGVALSIAYNYMSKYKTTNLPNSEYVKEFFRISKDSQLENFYADPTISRSTALNKRGLVKRQKYIQELSKRYPLLNIQYQNSGGSDPYLRLIAYNKTKSDTQINKNAFFVLADNLKNKFGIDYEFVSKNKAREILKDHKYNNEPAFFYKGKVYFTEFNLEDPIHEYAHPFISAIRKLNPDLFNSLMEEAFEKHPEVINLVKKNYPELLDEDGYLTLEGIEEALVHILTDYAKDIINIETGQPSLAKKIWNAIVSIMETILGIKVVNIKDLNPNTKLKDLGQFFTGFEGKIDLNNNNIKQGIPELFDSNPELANQVYEALGFIKGINKLKFQDFKTKIGEATSLEEQVNKLKEYVEQFKTAYFVVNTDEDIQSNVFFIKEEAEKALKEYNNRGNLKFELDTTVGLTEKEIEIYKDVIDFLAENPDQNPLNEEEYTGAKKLEEYLKYKYEISSKQIRKVLIGNKEKERLTDFINANLELSQAQKIEGESGLPNNLVELELSKITPQQKQQALQQYSQYLDTIFPNSKVKDIVYHGTNAFLESFDKNKIASNTLNYGFYGKGFYFNETRNDLINWWKTLYKKEPNIVTAIINTKNPYKEASNVIEEKTKLGNKQETEEFTKNLLQKNYDAVLPQIPKEEGSNEFVVFEPEQIHILGSKQDIQGFKKFTDLKNNPNEEAPMFNRRPNITSEHSTSINYQKEKLGDKLTSVQSIIANKLVDTDVKKISGDTYSDGTTEYEAVTSVLKNTEGPHEEPEYYKFHEKDEGKYLEYREWGNQYDDLVGAIVMGYSFDEAYAFVKEKQIERGKSEKEVLDINIPRDIQESIYDEVQTMLDTQFSDYMLIPQVIFSSKTSKVAGTSDIVAISPTGEIKIIDVKSSKSSFFSPYYNKPFGKGSASKLQRYTAQLSMYKGLAIESGFEFEKLEDLMILNIHSQSNDSENVSEANTEGIFPVDAYSYILDKFKTTNPASKITLNEKNIVKKIRISLQEQLELLKKNTNIKKSDYKKYEIEKLVENISLIEQGKAINKFIDEIHATFVKRTTENNTYYGIKYNINTTAKKLASGSITPEEALEEFYYYKELVNVYQPIIDEINALVSGNEESESFNTKIAETNKAFDEIKKVYTDSVIPIISEILANQISPETNAEVKSIFEREYKILEKIKQKEGEDSKLYKAKIKEINRLKIKLKSDEGITKDVIAKALFKGSIEDVNIVDTFTLNASSTNNEIASLFSLHLKQGFENNRQKSIDLQNQAFKAFQDFAKGNNTFDPSKINDGLYETVSKFDGFDDEGNPKFKDEMFFISPIDYNKFYKEYAEYKKTLENLEKGAAQYKRAWIKANFKLRPEEDVVIVNPYNPKEKVIVEKGLKTLRREKENQLDDGIITKKEYDNFIESLEGKNINGEIHYTNMDLLVINDSKYSNEKYKNLNPKSKKYLDFLMATYLKSQARVGLDLHNKYRVPSVYKSKNDRIVQNGVLNYLKEIKTEIYESREDDVEEYGEKYSSGKRVVPMHYSYDMSASNVSLDLLRSIMLYDKASLDYELRTKNVPLTEALLDSVKMNAPQKRDSLGNLILSATAKKAGYDKEPLQSNNNLYKLLLAFAERNVYGITNVAHKVKIGNKEVHLDKVSDSVKGFASKVQIGGLNVIGAVANSLQANVQTFIESHGAQFFGKTLFGKAKVEYHKLNLDFIKDFDAGVSKSLIGQLVDLYDALQGEFVDKYGNKITGTRAKKLMNSDSWFFLHHKGEHAIQVQTMIATLMSIETVDAKGNKSNLYESYELGSDGIIKLKDGVTLPGIVSDNGKMSISVQNRLHALNKRMHGIYNSFDQPALKKYALGRLLYMYRDFVVPGFKKRYKSIGIDNELGGVTEGYYITFFKKVFSDYKTVLREMVGIQNPDLLPYERANLRKASIEMGIVFSTGLVIMMLNSLMEAADDDDKKLFQYGLLLSLRLNSELGLYGVIGDPQNKFFPNFMETYRTFRQPSAIVGTTNRFIKIMNLLITDPTAVYKRDSGIFEKGDSKLLAEIIKLIGITGTNFEPENMIKYIQMTSK